MQGILYETPSVFPFLFVTVVLGGAAAWATGRSCAHTWRPPAVLLAYLLLLALAIRFVHFSVLGDTLLSPHYFLVDAAVIVLAGFLAYRYTRTTQMTTQYYWLNQRTGPLTWRATTADANSGETPAKSG